MNTQERITVRTHLVHAGFRRIARDRKCEYDHKGKDGRFVGNYTEYWVHKDGTNIILKWGPKTRTKSEEPWDSNKMKIKACDQIIGVAMSDRCGLRNQS